MWLHSLHKNSTVYPPIQTTAVATMLCFPHEMVRELINFMEWFYWSEGRGGGGFGRKRQSSWWWRWWKVVMMVGWVVVVVEGCHGGGCG
ncbi:hypothetical protein Hanom_Chr12g01154771 [Helianthus anomalus]